MLISDWLAISTLNEGDSRDLEGLSMDSRTNISRVTVFASLRKAKLNKF